MKAIWKLFQSKKKQEYWLTRFVFLRVLGFVYLFAFLSLAMQVIPLIGEDGLLPAEHFLDRYDSRFESKWDAFMAHPTLFWFYISDTWLSVLAWLGVILSLVLLLGFANVPLLFILWILYMSFVHIGQLWYGYGWEIQLLETGFLAMFFVPLWSFEPFPALPPPSQVIWLLRWLAFRIHLGAGLIKIRGDTCWRDLTCLYSHYETQPIPNPLSPYFHFMPKLLHNVGVLFNHFVELIVPFFVFLSRFVPMAGALMLLFQIILILSGNLAFLNWVTIVPIISCFDDAFLQKLLPRFIVDKAKEASTKAKPSKANQTACWILVIVVALLSIPVIQNLLSSHQAMNTTYNQWNLVNTYGAFGSVGKERYELVVQGTLDEVITNQTLWKEYEFKAKPTDVRRPLPIIAPYQPRVDWQIWFAAMSSPQHEPWLIHFVWKLLHNDADAISLIAHNPFSDQPPKHIRIEYYRYEFLPPGNEAVWKRTYVGEWLPPLSMNTPGLKEAIAGQGWKTYD